MMVLSPHRLPRARRQLVAPGNPQTRCTEVRNVTQIDLLGRDVLFHDNRGSGKFQCRYQLHGGQSVRIVLFAIGQDARFSAGTCPVNFGSREQGTWGRQKPTRTRRTVGRSRLGHALTVCSRPNRANLPTPFVSSSVIEHTPRPTGVPPSASGGNLIFSAAGQPGPVPAPN